MKAKVLKKVFSLALASAVMMTALNAPIAAEGDTETGVKYIFFGARTLKSTTTETTEAGNEIENVILITPETDGTWYNVTRGVYASYSGGALYVGDATTYSGAINTVDRGSNYAANTVPLNLSRNNDEGTAGFEKNKEYRAYFEFTGASIDGARQAISELGLDNAYLRFSIGMPIAKGIDSSSISVGTFTKSGDSVVSNPSVSVSGLVSTVCAKGWCPVAEVSLRNLGLNSAEDLNDCSGLYFTFKTNKNLAYSSEDYYTGSALSLGAVCIAERINTDAVNFTADKVKNADSYSLLNCTPEKVVSGCVQASWANTTSTIGSIGAASSSADTTDGYLNLSVTKSVLQKAVEAGMIAEDSPITAPGSDLYRLFPLAKGNSSGDSPSTDIDTAKFLSDKTSLNGRNLTLTLKKGGSFWNYSAYKIGLAHVDTDNSVAFTDASGAAKKVYQTYIKWVDVTDKLKTYAPAYSKNEYYKLSVDINDILASQDSVQLHGSQETGLDLGKVNAVVIGITGTAQGTNALCIRNIGIETPYSKVSAVNDTSWSAPQQSYKPSYYAVCDMNDNVTAYTSDTSYTGAAGEPFKVYPYYGNGAYGAGTIIGSKKNFAFEKTEDGKARLTANNIAENAKSVNPVVITAYYTDGVLENVELSKDFTIAANAVNSSYEYTVQDGTHDSVRFMVFNNFSEILPLCPAWDFPL